MIGKLVQAVRSALLLRPKLVGEVRNTLDGFFNRGAAKFSSGADLIQEVISRNVLGITNMLRRIGHDSVDALRRRVLQSGIGADLRRGLIVVVVSCSAGTKNTGDFVEEDLCYCIHFLALVSPEVIWHDADVRWAGIEPLRLPRVLTSP